MVPEGYIPSKLVVVVSPIILGSFLIYEIYASIKYYRAFSGEVRYTIGTTTKRYIQSSGREINYTYYIKDSVYKGHAGYAYQSQVPGGKYWVKYSVEYPDVSEIYQNMPVPACIDTLPPNGFRG